VNADVHDIKVIFVDERDDSNRLASRGLARSGSWASPRRLPTRSINATGTRVRDLPITLDKLDRM
jgi:xanthine dehydrogenase YagR molybdenum-binding subunit